MAAIPISLGGGLWRARQVPRIRALCRLCAAALEAYEGIEGMVDDIDDPDELAEGIGM